MRRFPSIPTLSLVVATLAAGCSIQDRKTSGDLSILTPQAREALDRASTIYPQPLDGADWSRAFRGGGPEHLVFQVRGTNARDRVIEMEVTGAGRIIEVEEHGIPFGEVPLVVRFAMKLAKPGFTPDHVEAVYQSGHVQPVSYGFEGKDAGGRDVEIYFSADGKALN